MNKVTLIGRLTKDVELREAQDTKVARYTLAVDRRKQGEADFPEIVAFNKGAEFASKYFRKGMRVAVSGRIQTGSYTNKDGVKIYTTNVIADEQEFADGKREQTTSNEDENPFDDLPFK